MGAPGCLVFVECFVNVDLVMFGVFGGWFVEYGLVGCDVVWMCVDFECVVELREVLCVFLFVNNGVVV